VQVEVEGRTRVFFAVDLRSRRPSGRTSCCEIDSPRPVPPYSRVVEPLAWLKARNSLALLLRRHADAGVAHRKAQSALCRAGSAFQQRCTDSSSSPAGREFDRVVDQVDQHLPQPQRIAHRWRGNRRRHVEQVFELLVGRALAGHAGHIGQHIVQEEGNLLDFQLAGLDLREVEDVVDDPQQRQRGAVDLARRNRAAWA
jgi:hypothetical protein